MLWYSGLLSTHFCLCCTCVCIPGDRIAIISQGSLLCCGTFEYLKHRYGHGHRLTLVTKCPEDSISTKTSHTFTVVADVEHVDYDLNTEHKDIEMEGLYPPSSSNMPHPSSSSNSPHPSSSNTPHLSDVSHSFSPRESRSPSPQQSAHEVMAFLKEQIVGAELIEMRGQELHVLLPLLQSRPRVLAQLFGELDNKKDKLNITSYGLTACSMEEVGVASVGRNVII